MQPSVNYERFLFRFLRNETVLFSVQGRTIYIMICNNPIRAQFVTVYVNTVEIRSSQQDVAFRTFQLVLLYSKMRNYACNSCFSILKYPSKLHTGLLFVGASRFCSEKGKKLLRNMPKSCSKVA